MPYKAVFLDRDDTIVDDPGYIRKPEQLQLIPGATDALKQLKKLGYLLVIVTNQSGIARGFLTEQDLEGIHQELKRQLTTEGATIDGLYYCPYHPDGNVKDFSIESNLRKPNAGMFFLAEKELDIDLEQSWMIGDSYRDIKAGKAAGCHTILVDVPGKIREKKSTDPEPDRKAVNLREAVNIIRMHEFHQKAKSIKSDTPKRSESEADNEDIDGKSQANDSINQSDAEPEESKKVSIPETAAEPDMKKKSENISDIPPIKKPKPNKVNTIKNKPSEALPQNTEPNRDIRDTHHLLEEIALRLKRSDREGLYEEFSVFKLLAFMVQAIALLCLVFSICLWLSPKDRHVQVQTMIGFTVALQLIVITMLMMHSRN